MFKVTISNGPHQGQSFQLDFFPVTIGRDPKNTIVLNDERISHNHALLNYQNGKIAIKDLNSAHGTLVNELPVKECILHDGDHVTLGTTILTLMTQETTPQKPQLSKQPKIKILHDDETSINFMLPCSSKEMLHFTEHFKNDPERLVKNLATIFEASELIYKIINEDQLFKTITDLLFRVIDCDRMIILIPNAEHDWFPHYMRRKQSPGKFYPLAVSQSIIKKVTQDQIGVAIKNTSLEKITSQSESILMLGIRSAMCVPIKIKNTIVGLAYADILFSDHFFDEFELQLLVAIANQASIAIENCRLHAKLHEQEKVRNELKIAQDIQNNLLPKTNPKIPKCDFVFKCKPAEEVGGDYMDWFPLNDHELALVIADVSGKGIPGAIIMSMFKAMVRSKAMLSLSPSHLLKIINETLLENLQSMMFITAIYGIYHVENHTFTFGRAGHLPLIHFRNNGKIVDIHHPKGIALGIESWKNQIEIEEQVIHISKNDTIFLYTDGLIECTNHQDQELGSDALYHIIQEYYTLDLQNLQEHIFQNIQNYIKQTYPNDDMTMCMLRRLED